LRIRQRGHSVTPATLLELEGSRRQRRPRLFSRFAMRPGNWHRSRSWPHPSALIQPFGCSIRSTPACSCSTTLATRGASVPSKRRPYVMTARADSRLKPAWHATFTVWVCIRAAGALSRCLLMVSCTIAQHYGPIEPYAFANRLMSVRI
jgi:hypothetical protein